MEKKEIMEFLPHRNSMLLVDEAFCDGVVGGGSYTIKGNEFFLDGHFPNNPTVPGVILCEISAQICSIALADLLKNKDSIPYFTSINNVKFRRMIVPKEKFEVKFELEKSKHPFYFFKVVGSVDGQKAMSGDFSFALNKN